MRIIDGYNLIGAAGAFGLALSQPDKEERLLRLLSTFRSRRRSARAMLVVFDGHYGRLAVGPRRYSQTGIDVEWTLGETADAAIERKVRSAARASEIQVVTSDELLLRGVVSRGAQQLRCPAFLEELAAALAEEPAAEKPEQSSPAEVAEWLERFGDGR